jgi:hypothetical protein
MRAQTNATKRQMTVPDNRNMPVLALPPGRGSHAQSLDAQNNTITSIRTLCRVLRTPSR